MADTAERVGAADSATTKIDGIDVHIGTISSLVERANRISQPTDVVLAPVQLHRRNFKLRLTAAGEPLDAFQLTDQTALATHLLEQAGKQAAALSRIDRLSLVKEILADRDGRIGNRHDDGSGNGQANGSDTGADAFSRVLGGAPAANAKVVEQARTAVASLTNFHPDRWQALSDAAESCRSPIDADVHDLLAGVVGIKRELARRHERAPSDVELVRRATRLLHTTAGAAWDPPAPTIERVTAVGLSSIPAPLIDLLTVLARQTSVDVHLILRPVTGEYLQHRLADVLVETPGRGIIR